MTVDSKRKRIITQILDSIAGDDGSFAQDFYREVTIGGILEGTGSLNGEPTVAVRESDVLRFGYAKTARRQLSAQTLERLKKELDTWLTSISGFLRPADPDALRLTEPPGDLPAALTASLEEREATESDIEKACERIESLAAGNEKTHSELRKDLLDYLSKHSENMHRKHSASHDLLSTTIETSLIKLSLIRARARNSLYGQKSPSGGADMVQGLANAHAKLKQEEQSLDEEIRATDRQIAEYETMLRLVDGSGGFAQVVGDWATVQREMEECRKDLRRLGWTGD